VSARLIYGTLGAILNMRNRRKQLTALFVMMGMAMATWSCSKGQTGTPKIMTRITELREFKAEEKRIDSLKQTGQKVDITISIIKASFDAEDSAKGVSTAFINEDIGFDETILYTIKFDSKTEEIISVKSNKRY
jgi:hypothetical protein